VTHFKYYPLAQVDQAKGDVVVIDVLRAFTTAAYAFGRGVEKILPVSSTADALKIKTQFSGSLIMGEENGLKPEGFDFGNSPVEINRQNFTNKMLIQRTSAGTQGLIRSENHRILLAASFVVASVTAEYLKTINPEKVSFIITGKSMGRDGDVDVLLVHALKAEEKFVAEGFGDKRFPVMYNDFVIVGPADEASSFSSIRKAADALDRIASATLRRKYGQIGS